MKKKFALIATLGLSFMFSSNVFAATTFTDIGNSYAKDEIQKLANDGIVKGDGINKFRPTDKITRQEFAVILAKSLDLEIDAAPAAKFTDVDSWARPYVGALYKAGVTSGTSSTTFGATDNLTREDLAVFYVRAMKFEKYGNLLYKQGYLDMIAKPFTDAGDISPYAKGDVAIAKAIGFVQGANNRFNPKNLSERQAVARLAYEFIYHYDSVYVPNYVKVLMPEATSCTLKEDGTYATTLTQKPGLLKQAIHFSFEEAVSISPFAYQSYRLALANNEFFTFWVDNLDAKTGFSATILTSWALDDSGVQFKTLKPDSTFEEFENAMNILIGAIDAYHAKNPNQGLDENGLINIGKECGILK